MRIFVALFSIFLAASSADACTIATAEPHQVRRDASDTRAPSKVVAAVIEIRRGGQRLDFCSDIGWIGIRVHAAADAETPAEKLGYRLTLAKGRLPRGLRLPKNPIRGDRDRTLWLHWMDRGGPLFKSRIDFSVRITAVDLAGNEGPTSEPVRVFQR